MAEAIAVAMAIAKAEQEKLMAEVRVE